MFDELMSGVRKVNDMTEEEKEIERLKRDRNLFEKEVSILKKQNNELITENNYYKKIGKLFVTVRTNIKMVVNRYKDSERKPDYYDMFAKLDKQIDEELEIVNEKEDISD